MAARFRCITRICALAALLAACDDECPQVRRCDIRQRDCQRNTLRAVACLRGGDGEGALPPVSVISEEQFRARIRAAAEELDNVAELEQRYALWTRGLALFELAPADYDVDDALVDATALAAAAYFNGDGDIVIIDRGEPLSDAGAVELFAHEIVHALQDRELDLTTYGEDLATTLDASLALDALIEGEAVHYQVLAAVELAGHTPDDVDWDDLYQDWIDETLLEAEDDVAPVALADTRFPYAFGGKLVTQAWLERGRAGIDELFERPPLRTSTVMFGTGRAPLRAEQDALVPRAVPELPEPFVEISSTTLGSWIARMYAARKQVPFQQRMAIARALGADTFSVHHDEPNDTVVAAWRTRMLESAADQRWPDAMDPAVVTAVSSDAREVAQLSAEDTLPEGAELLAWRMQAVDGDDDPAPAAATTLELGAGRKPYRACAVRHASPIGD